MADPQTEELREMAAHRGFRLIRSRRRKPGGDFGCYGLVDRKSGKDVFGIGKRGLRATGDQIEDFLRGQAAATWGSSIKAAGRSDRAESPPRAKIAEEPDPASRRRPRRETDKRPAEASPKRQKEAEMAQVRSRPQPEPPALHVRKATKEDAPAIAKLLEDIGASIAPEDLASRIGSLARRKTPILVADRGEVIGFVAYQPLDLLHRAAPMGRISAIAVRKSDRRRGVGTALLSAVEDRLGTLGCEAFEAMSGIEVSGPQGFFRESGYRKTYRYTKERSA